ncbi:MAG TPA: WYL domain-containing protein [Marmoricola sp.]|nr:WYL domain-containing protein [Marmoricola sp.]
MTAPNARDQVTRLLALVPYLQSRGEISVADAAREFGVSPKVIRRDINVLLFCGLPGLGMGDLIEVDFEALEGDDVIRLSNADYLARPLRLDTTEAAALVVGLRTLLEGSGEEEREVVERTLRKVEEAAGEAAGVAAQVTLHVPEDEGEQSLHDQLAGAVAGKRQVRLHHRSAVRDEVTERVVDPIAVLSQEGHTYLDAWCHRVEDRRLFRLDRVAAVELLDSPVTEHASQPPLDLSEGIFRPAPDALLATLRLGPQARWVTEYHPVESAIEEPDGGLTVTLRVGDPAWLARLLLRLGGAAALVDPPALAEQVRNTALRALQHYAE